MLRLNNWMRIQAILVVLLFGLARCISVPETTPKSERCIKGFHETRRQISEIQQWNRVAGGSIAASLGLGIWIPFLLVHTVIIGPSWMIMNWDEAMRIENDWLRTCKQAANRKTLENQDLPETN